MTNPLETVSAPTRSLRAGQRATRSWRAGTLVYTAGGLAVLFFWLLWGDFAWQLRERSVNPVLQVMLKQHGASDFLNGLLIASIPALLSVVIGPVISCKSDRHRSPRGRRIPFLLYSTPFAAGSMFLMACTPWLGEQMHTLLGASSPGLNVCVLWAIGIAWTLFEVSALAGNLLFGPLVRDVVPTAMLGRFFGLCRACSLLAGILFNKVLFAKADEHYALIFGGIGLLFGVGFVMMCLQVKEGEYPPPPPPDDRVPAGFISACKTYCRECYSNSYYLTIFLVSGIATISFMPLNLFSVFYADSIGMSRQSYGDHVAVTFTISLVSAYFLGWLADRFHPLRMGIFSLCLYILTAIWGGFTATDPRNFGIAFVAHGVVSGMYFTTTASLAARLFPHTLFAQFASAAGLLAALMNASFPLVIGFVLDSTGRDYRQTFFWSAVLAGIGVIGLLRIHASWLRLGGVKHYEPPATDRQPQTGL